MRLERYGFILLTFYAVFITAGYANRFAEIGFFNHIFLTIISAGWLIYRLRSGKGLPPSRLNAPIITFLGLALVASLLSESPRMAIEHLWRSIMSYMVFLFVLNAFHRARNKLVMETVFLVAAIIVFLSFLQVFSVIFGLGFVRAPGQGWIEFIGTGIRFPWSKDLRIALPLSTSTQVAGFLGTLIVICITWAVSVTRKSYRTILWTLVSLLTIALLLTQSRAGLISLTLGLIAFFIFNRIKSIELSGIFKRNNMIVGAGVLAIFVAVIAVVLVIGSQRGRQSGDSVRLDMWRSAITMTVNDPLTGVGTGQFGRIHREQWGYETAREVLYSPDNLYLTFLSENGVLVILIGLWVVWIIGSDWWALRKEAQFKSARWLRLNGMMAALLTFCIHRAFDTLAGFESIALFSVVIVYCTVKPARSRLDAPPEGNKILAIAATTVILAYGLWFVLIVDPAHRHLINSTNPEFEQLTEAQLARDLDPYVNLYTLQIAYLEGANALDNSTQDALQNAINLYLEAIELEPTWDTGMMNLAALYEANGEPEQALIWLAEAQTVFRNSAAHLHWSRIAEANNLADDSEIVDNYVRSMELSGILPLSTFWVETTLREEAMLSYTEQTTPDRKYRIFQVYYPDQLDNLVPENPQTAPEWWIVGEHALTIGNDRDAAIEAFTNAIEVNPNYGDYYASRARAYANAEEAQRDLQIASFLGTSEEYINIIRLDFTSDPEEIDNLRRNAVPAYLQSVAFENIVFNGRAALFTPYDSVRQIGRGNDVMQVLYDLAAEYEANGDIEEAIIVYEAIAFRAPEDDRALTEIERLQQP